MASVITSSARDHVARHLFVLLTAAVVAGAGLVRVGLAAGDEITERREGSGGIVISLWCVEYVLVIANILRRSGSICHRCLVVMLDIKVLAGPSCPTARLGFLLATVAPRSCLNSAGRLEALTGLGSSLGLHLLVVSSHVLPTIRRRSILHYVLEPVFEQRESGIFSPGIFSHDSEYLAG
ncbi:hypothetical protein B0T14DRAFT_509968 [Immersiella caudata]|uniref:Uncharacterized protein n=1 Tax=Immersiella caudata TaxID=314043 RepID=A0AA39X3E0_9PEZI|nr:hypothetical protein B0T14DRAFT_509968 [Immersiella caudata]